MLCILIWSYFGRKHLPFWLISKGYEIHYIGAGKTKPENLECMFEKTAINKHLAKRRNFICYQNVVLKTVYFPARMKSLFEADLNDIYQLTWKNTQKSIPPYFRCIIYNSIA